MRVWCCLIENNFSSPGTMFMLVPPMIVLRIRRTVRQYDTYEDTHMYMYVYNIQALSIIDDVLQI